LCSLFLEMGFSLCVFEVQRGANNKCSTNGIFLAWHLSGGRTSTTNQPNQQQRENNNAFQCNTILPKESLPHLKDFSCVAETSEKYSCPIVRFSHMDVFCFSSS
jgi:hypothetical protein